MHLIYPILTRSNQLNYVVNNNSSSCSIIFYLKWVQYFTVSEKWLGLINRWKKNIFKKRIKGQLLNADCSITQRTFTHKSFFQRSAAQQAFTNKRISNTIWNPVLASTVQICLLICRRAQKQYSCVLLCKCQPYGSANSVLYKPFCISISTCYLFCLTGTNKCCFGARHCRMSLDALAYFWVHFLNRINI